MRRTLAWIGAVTVCGLSSLIGTPAAGTPLRHAAGHHAGSSVAPIALGALAHRSDWLSRLPALLGAVNACYAQLPRSDRAAFVFDALPSGDNILVKLAIDSDPKRQRQMVCSATPSSDGGIAASIDATDKDFYEPLHGPYFAKDARSFPSERPLTVERVVDRLKRDRGFVAI